jgi:threonine/homoserine/homoserine lactone efflux protein
MLPITQLIYFSLSVIVLIIIPGPTMLYLISRSLLQGQKAGMISLLGIVTGDLFYILLSSFGLSAALFTFPLLFHILKLSGALYLLYLAYQAVRVPSFDSTKSHKGLIKDKPQKLFVIGLLTTISNPKVALFFVSVFSQFLDPKSGDIGHQFLLLGSIFITISLLINSLIIFSASKSKIRLSKNPKLIKVQNWAIAGILMALAIKMAFTGI